MKGSRLIFSKWTSFACVHKTWASQVEGRWIKPLLLCLGHTSLCKQPKDECAAPEPRALCWDHKLPSLSFYISAKYLNKNILNATISWNLISFFTSHSQLLEIKHYHHHILIERLWVPWNVDSGLGAFHLWSLPSRKLRFMRKICKHKFSVFSL